MAWAAGVLKDLGFPATFFVIAGFADRARPPRAYWETWGHLGWTDLARLVNDGFELGAHSVTHPDLTHCSDGQLHEEVDGARRLLEGRLGVGVSSFSYPYGRHDARVRRAVQAAGFRLACTSTYGRNDVLKSPYEVRRTEISGRDDAADFRAKLEGRYDWLRYWQRLPGLRSAPAR
jgi:peptidoglycan/xylan/chitin deacetylase (PgdA/CDA1 family)